MRTRAELEKAVVNGAALLDLTKPGWREKIDLPTLSLASVASCVLGQLYGSFGDGMDELEQERYLSAPDLGFDHLGGDVEADDVYPVLDELWTAEIQRGRGE